MFGCFWETFLPLWLLHHHLEEMQNAFSKHLILNKLSE